MKAKVVKINKTEFLIIPASSLFLFFESIDTMRLDIQIVVSIKKSLSSYYDNQQIIMEIKKELKEKDAQFVAFDVSFSLNQMRGLGIATIIQYINDNL